VSQRVLMVIDSLRVGGAERITLTLAELFVKQGIAVDIIGIYDYVEYEVPEGINLYTVGFKKRLLQNVLYKKALHTKIKALEKVHDHVYDLVLVHLLKAARLMQDFKHKDLYYVLHSTMSQESLAGLEGSKYQRKLRRLKKKFDHKNIITVSQGIADDLIKNVGITPKSVSLIYNPIDIESIQKAAQEENICHEERPYIVHLGRLVPLKRHDRLLRAFKEADLDAKLVLIGEGTHQKTIEEEVAALGLEEKVLFVGMQTNPYPIIKEARLLVLTSDYEGLSMAILEALALGVPVVSTDCPSGPREILEGYLDNALVPLDDDKKLVEMMRKQFESPSPIDVRVLERFDGAKVIDQYLALMQESL